MNKTKRFFYGVLSSLLLAAGFARAADGLDPMTKTLGADASSPVASTAAEPCTAPCDDTDPT